MIQSKMSGMLGGSTGAGAASGGSSQASTLMSELASLFVRRLPLSLALTAGLCETQTLLLSS